MTMQIWRRYNNKEKQSTRVVKRQCCQFSGEKKLSPSAAREVDEKTNFPFWICIFSRSEMEIDK